MGTMPSYEDLLAALAIEIVTTDALRERLGLPPEDGRRSYTAVDLLRGRSTGPQVEMDQQGNLHVRLES